MYTLLSYLAGFLSLYILLVLLFPAKVDKGQKFSSSQQPRGLGKTDSVSTQVTKVHISPRTKVLPATNLKCRDQPESHSWEMVEPGEDTDLAPRVHTH